MALKHLTEEQIRTWTLDQKDRWWLENVFRGNMPQLTIRAAITGFLLGGILSATNLYVGAKTGWTLGVGLTSVILAFSAFKVMSSIGLGRDFTILENNCMQSIATAAGYMTGPLISGIAAWMWVENRIMPWWQLMAFTVVLSILGVLVAFPMKRRFINDEQQPFPEGRACGVVLDTLYNSDASVGLFKAKALAVAAFGAAFLKLISGENLMQFLQERILGVAKDKVWHLNEHLDAWYYWLADKKLVPIPTLSGVPIRNLGLSPTMELAMVGAGGLMGIRAASSMLIGSMFNFLIIVPLMIAFGEIKPKAGETTEQITRIWALNSWALWWGIAIMVTAALTGLFAKPKIIITAFTGLFKRGRQSESQSLKKIELPLWVSFVGIPIVGAVGVWMSHEWFGVHILFGALAIPLIIVLSLIAANSTALTGITPTGAMSKIPQFIFGAADPKNPATNLMTGVMCIEVASNASNLLMDIKPGYMLGAKPRQQAIGHVIGIIAGALASTPLFFALFLSDWKGEPGQSIEAVMVTEQFGFPSAMQWKGVSDLVTSVFGSGGTAIPNSAVWSMVIAATVGLFMEIIRIRSRGKFPLSPLAIGLGVVVPPDSTMAMFFGALMFWALHRFYDRREGSFGNRLWVQTQEPICAGLIAGFALMGIADILVKVFLLK
ncbi:MAG: OPT/YSL family transporter [Phycisphaeraceae bacterium]|nr:OPT/YSL family transporter [Phycisphaeraceae bacterium]